MNKLILLFSTVILSGLAAPAYGGCGKILQEATTKKDPLPVKYKKLLKENEQMRAELDECMSRKAELQSSIESLSAQISALESEKANLESELNSMPSREELEAKIRTLEEQQ